MNKRLLNFKDYGISKGRQIELKGFCKQYPDWKDELRYKTDTVKSKIITDMPLPPHRNSDATGDLAVKRVEMEEKCKMIEECLWEASGNNDTLYDALLKSVCYDIPFYDIDTAYCGIATFTDYRRKFFGLLHLRKK